MGQHLYKRGNVWWCWVYDQKGRRLSRSTGCTDRRAAEAYRARLERQAQGAVHSPEDAAPYSLAEACADFLEQGLAGVKPTTAKMYAVKAGHVSRLLGSVDLADLTKARVEAFVEARRAEGAKDHTIHKDLVALRRVLSRAAEQGLAPASWRDCLPKFRAAYSPRDRWLTEAEYRRLLLALRPQRRLWLTTAVFTGGRVSELEALEWGRDLDLKGGWVCLTTAKRRLNTSVEKRHIPLAAELLGELRAVEPKTGKLFPEPWKNPALRLTQTARKAGIVGPGETLNDNDLRRTFASWLLQRGATVKEVADLLGHGSTQMVERVYGHLAAGNLRAAVDRLPHFGEGSKRPRKPRRSL